ncbi:MAG: M28 family peptidase [Salinivirgaceae bacterium]
MKQLVFGILFTVLCWKVGFSQDSLYPRYIINTLGSNKFSGRGYVKDGDLKAARFIAKELKLMAINPILKTYYQNLSFPMNSFPGTMSVALSGKPLNAVADFVVAPDCQSVRGVFDLVYLPQSCDTNDQVFDSLKNVNYSGKIVVAPFIKRNWKLENPFQSAGWIIPRKSIYWWASTGHQEAKSPQLFINDSLMALKPDRIELDIKNQFFPEYSTQNVLGFVRGSQLPDSFIVFTAHYDHLGVMGKNNVFRGANDNASGTSMVLALASYFSKPENKPKYSIAFLFFAAEEAGVLGSMYYVSNPAFPLSKIKALINLDMVGSGSEGISIVNGEANPFIVNKIKALNLKNNYFSDIRIGGESCNSDHCYFHKAGVPAVFIFTRGPECKEYHNLKDIPETLPLTMFTELKKMLIDLTIQ